MKQVYENVFAQLLVLVLVISFLSCDAQKKGISLKEYAAKNEVKAYIATKGAVLPLGGSDQLNNLLEEGNNVLPLSYRELSDIDGISELPVSFEGKTVLVKDIPNLQIFLNNNRLSELPEEITRLSNVSFIYLKNNRFTSIPGFLGRMSNLKGIYFTKNRITSLPDSLFRLSQLRKLEVAQNRIGGLPPGIGNLTELIHFNIADNPLGKLPETVVNLKKLRVCDFSRTGISELPKDFALIPIMHQLRLSGNPDLKVLPVGKGFEDMTGTIEITGTGIDKKALPLSIQKNISKTKRPGTRKNLVTKGDPDNKQ